MLRSPSKLNTKIELVKWLNNYLKYFKNIPSNAYNQRITNSYSHNQDKNMDEYTLNEHIATNGFDGDSCEPLYTSKTPSYFKNKRKEWFALPLTQENLVKITSQTLKVVMSNQYKDKDLNFFGGILSVMRVFVGDAETKLGFYQQQN